MVRQPNEIFTLALARTKSVILALLLLSLFWVDKSQTLHAQRVAVVLSGGGASAYAHIGFLRALEENNIPIDAIAGTSMGAIIGGLYACGYTPDEIERLLTSKDFQNQIEGTAEAEKQYFFKQRANNAGWINLQFRGDGALQKNLPTHLIDPLALDYELLRLTANANAKAHRNFDSLFVPFRCVAADIATKTATVLDSGSLSQAIRVSSSYPFYVRPIQREGRLLFDGGLYNNFPVDVAIEDFKPDVILGCNVSYNYEAPEADDILSQLKNMLVSQTNYGLRGYTGLVVEPKDDISTFDFSRYEEAIASGYQSTQAKIDSIRYLVSKEESPTVRKEKRLAFRQGDRSFAVQEIELTNINTRQASYIKQAIVKKQVAPQLRDLRPNILALQADPFVQYLYPTARYQEKDSAFTLAFDVDLERKYYASFGGNVSNQAINTGFVELGYIHLGKRGTEVNANTYFGKYYAALGIQSRFIWEGKFPFSISPYLYFNRWDYFRSRTSFFEESPPSFVIENERFAGAKFAIPEGYDGTLSVEGNYFINAPDYYLTRDFTNADTSDMTSFEGARASITWERNTLNQKQYADAGSSLFLRLSYVNGVESYTPGSTSQAPAIADDRKSWVELKFSWKQFYPITQRLKTYPMVDLRLASRYTFSNFRATKIFQPQYNPLTESPTLYLPRYRALNFGGFGFGLEYSFTDDLSLRTQHHLFQPVNEIEQGLLDQTAFGDLLAERFYIGGMALVYQTPLGPIALNLNYYDQTDNPWSFMFNLGYILFNPRSL